MTDESLIDIIMGAVPGDLHSSQASAILEAFAKAGIVLVRTSDSGADKAALDVFIDPELVQPLVDRIGPILHGRGPAIQGAVLADLVAMLLAGHIGPDAERLREELLDLHIETVRKLVPPNEALILERMKPKGRG